MMTDEKIDKKDLEPLSPAAAQFLKIMRMFNDKPMQLGYFAHMISRTRRYVRMLIRELREKGYVKVYPENMRIFHKDHCKFIILVDQLDETSEYQVSDEIKERIKE